MPDIISQIKFKLAELKRLDTDFKVFGACSHQYQLNPVVKVRDIIQFEKKYSCTLPETYRRFLMELGNGGAGPVYGVFPLGYMDGQDGEEAWTSDFVNPDKPFKFFNSYNDTSILTRGKPKESEFDSYEEYISARNFWLDLDETNYDLQLEYWEAHAMDGAVPVCHRGCCLRTWLVVGAGREHGNIWHDDTADNEGVYPEIPSIHKHRVNFAEWYLDWIDKSLEEITSETL